jgi:hypothetical protein
VTAYFVAKPPTSCLAALDIVAEGTVGLSSLVDSASRCSSEETAVSLTIFASRMISTSCAYVGVTNAKPQKIVPAQNVFRMASARFKQMRAL